jgi:serine/threonine protein kinase
MAVVPGQSFGNFQIVRLLGEGGFGEVYEAENPFLQRRAAIKVLHAGMVKDAELVRRFLNEARAASAIRHPNIIDVFDAGMTPTGEPYILMEFLEGDSLQKHLLQNGRMPLRTVQEVTRQAGSALSAAHVEGIVHRDLKPENLFLIPDSGSPVGFRVKVLDFGIAKIKHRDDRLSTVKTQAGLLMGSPAYMSPEQCKDSSDVDLRSDIYSLGILVFEMLTGVPPFVSNSAAEMLVMQITAEPSPLRGQVPELPEYVEQTVMRALAKEREKRYSSVDYFVGALLGTYPALTTQGSHTITAKAVVEDGSPGQASSSGINALGRPKTMSMASDGVVSRAGLTPMPTPLSKSTVTTLSNATGETDPSLAPLNSDGTTEIIKHNRWPIVVVAGVVATAGVLFFMFRPNGSSAPSKQSASSVSATSVALTSVAPASVRLLIESSPSGAAVIDEKDGNVLGATPLEKSYRQSTESLRMKLRLGGYKDKNITIRLDSNSSTSVELDAIEPEPATKSTKGESGQRKSSGIHKQTKPSQDQDEEAQWRVH